MRFAFLPGLAGAAVLALVAAIVVGLYLLRPPPQRMVLASTLLWERVLQRTRGASQRWRWWLSLLLSTLIALAVAHAVQCPYCIDAYTSGSLEKGATPDQMTEAVHVAAAIRGGASLVHAVQMRNKIDKIGM